MSTTADNCGREMDISRGGRKMIKTNKILKIMYKRGQYTRTNGAKRGERNRDTIKEKEVRKIETEKERGRRKE
jgi:hypothetical protein